MEPRNFVMELDGNVVVESVEEGAYMLKALAELTSTPSHELSAPIRTCSVVREDSTTSVPSTVFVSSAARS
jgi:hypothetical protein